MRPVEVVRSPQDQVPLDECLLRDGVLDWASHVRWLGHLPEPRAVGKGHEGGVGPRFASGRRRRPRRHDKIDR